jgi:hypothetical protein
MFAMLFEDFRTTPSTVMAGLVPATQDHPCNTAILDGRHGSKRQRTNGHDGCFFSRSTGGQT